MRCFCNQGKFRRKWPREKLCVANQQHLIAGNSCDRHVGIIILGHLSGQNCARSEAHPAPSPMHRSGESVADFCRKILELSGRKGLPTAVHTFRSAGTLVSWCPEPTATSSISVCGRSSQRWCETPDNIAVAMPTQCDGGNTDKHRRNKNATRNATLRVPIPGTNYKRADQAQCRE